MTNEKQFSDLEQNRIDKLLRLREQGMEPYPARSERTHTNLEAIADFEKTEKDENSEPVKATLVGRIRSMRPMGKLVFTHIEDGSGTIQLFIRANDVGVEQLDLL